MLKIKLIRQFCYKDYDGRLIKWSKISKNLYNQVLYVQKQNLRKKGEVLSLTELDKTMREIKNKEGNINYRLLPKSHVAQHTIRLVDKSIKSYFNSKKEYEKNPKKFTGKPQFPKYLEKTRYILIFTNQHSKIKDKKIYLTKDYIISIPEAVWIDELNNYNQIRIIPKYENRFKIEIIYEKQVENKELDYSKYSSIDLGLNNLVTLVMENEKPLLIKGGIIKSLNQYFNKKLSKLYSLQDKSNNKHKESKRINKLFEIRNRKINDYFHKVSRFIIDYLVHKKIGNLIIGHTKNWKQKINIGRKNNQQFVQVPYNKLIRMLEYKAQIQGIKVVQVSEEYTSKVDALALEPLKKKKQYIGKRIFRGLFQSSIGKLINADVNAALNIMRKVVGDFVIRRIANSVALFLPRSLKSIYAIDEDYKNKLFC